MSSSRAATRWQGVPLDARRAERRALLVDAAIVLLRRSEELSVRALCRESELNARYFYESFETVDDLVGAVYDRLAAELAELLAAELDEASADVAERVRRSLRVVLRYVAGDPARGRVLLTMTQPADVLGPRRLHAAEQVRELFLLEGERADPAHRDRDPVLVDVWVAMFAGAMASLAEQWVSGGLGDDLDAVVDAAVQFVMVRS